MLATTGHKLGVFFNYAGSLVDNAAILKAYHKLFVLAIYLLVQNSESLGIGQFYLYFLLSDYLPLCLSELGGEWAWTLVKYLHLSPWHIESVVVMQHKLGVPVPWIVSADVRYESIRLEFWYFEFILFLIFGSIQYWNCAIFSHN